MKTLLRGGALAVFGLVVGAAAAVATPYAVNVPGSGCEMYDFDFSYRLVNSDPPDINGWPSLTQDDWDAASITIMADGASTWEQVRDKIGSFIVDVSNPGATGDVPIYLVDVNPDGLGAVTGCSGSTEFMLLDFRSAGGGIETDADLLEGIVTHESGHAVSLEHPGEEDDIFTVDVPSVATGQPEEEWGDLRDLEWDDWAGIQYADNDDFLTPNGSVETANRKPWTDFSSTVTVHSPGAVKGTYYAKMLGANDYTQNTTRLWDPPDNMSVDVFGWFKRDSYAPGVLGTDDVRLKLRAREISVNGGTSDAFDHISGSWNLNEIAAPGPFVTYKSKVKAVTELWAATSTGEWSIDNSWLGVDLQVRITNDVTDFNGAGLPLYFDYTTVREK